jgi:hypothetical protein
MNLVRSIQALGRWFAVGTLGLSGACVVDSPAVDPDLAAGSSAAVAACPGSPGPCAAFPFQFAQQAEPAWGDATRMVSAPTLAAGTGFERGCKAGDSVCALEVKLAALGCKAGGVVVQTKTGPSTVRRYSRASTLGSACNSFFLWGKCPVSDGLSAAITQYGGDVCPAVMLRVDFYYVTSASGSTTIYCPTAAPVAGSSCLPWPAGTVKPPATWTAVMDWDPLCSGCRIANATRTCIDSGGQLICSGNTIWPAGNY